MKKKTTIFRQLLFTVLAPMILIIAGISVYDFWSERERIFENRKEHISQVKVELKDFVGFFDKTIAEFENKLSEQAYHFSDTLVNHIFKSTKNIETIDLDTLRKSIGMSTDQDIYIVNKQGIIVNTTFEKDLGLDFFSFGQFFIDHFNYVWATGDFVEDRISLEMSTKLPKKYTYQSTLDKQYVVELGMYDTYSKNMVLLFAEKLNAISDKYNDIDSISLYFGTDKFINYQGHEMTAEEMDMVSAKLEESTEYKNEYQTAGVNHTTLFMLLDLAESALEDAYVIRVKYNNANEQVLVKNEFVRFGWLMLLFIVPIIVLILWRARVLSQPIGVLLEKVDEIRKGDLETKAPLIGNNEITELSHHFNGMISQLKQSYDTLEEKVAERTEELVHKNKLIESTHRSIQDSINYSKRLQKAILPNIASIRNRIPESFVFFKPKDVVSGDFYWFESTDNYDFIAAADCTGHGVPGAMVSFVCNNALNRSIFEFDKISPENVLNTTRDLIIETFSKSSEDIRDGMDIALCRIDKSKQELLFVGANNPFWIIRKTDYLTDEERDDRKTVLGDEYSLIEVKGDKKPVGLHDDMTPFTCNKVKIFEGDSYYLFTDGYADQFGGNKGKKMMYKPFKKLLLEINDQSMDDRKQILMNSFEDWMGDYEQVDDICVIGFKL